MNWNRSKLLIISALLALNIFFGFQIYHTYNNKLFLSQEFLSNAVENLSTKNVLVNKNIIYTRIPINDIYSYSSVRPYAKEFEDSEKYSYISKISAALINGKNDFELGYFDIPYGVSVNITAKNADESTPDIGTITFTETFGCDFIRSGFDASILPAEYLSGENDIYYYRAQGNTASKGSAKIVKGFFNHIYGAANSGKNYEIISSKKVSDGEIITCVQKLENLKFDQMILHFYISGDAIMSFSGKWCFEPEKAYHSKLIDGINALYLLESSGTGQINVDEESLIYLPVKVSSDEYLLIPSWSIIFRDNSDEKVNNIYDAITGKQRLTKYLK